MKMKYFDVDQLSVGCLGSMSYPEDSKWPDWNKKKSCPYTIYRERQSDSSYVKREGINVFSGEKYYFLNEASRKSCPAGETQGKYIIGKSVPLSIIFEKDKKKISLIELKSIVCNFNLTDALIKDKKDDYLILLRSCLNDIDLMGNGKVKEEYITRILALIEIYSYIAFVSFDQEKYDIVIESINNMRHELDEEKEIIAIKRRELMEKKKTRKLQ